MNFFPYSRILNNRGAGIIGGGSKIFEKLIKGGWNKRGMENGWDRKQKKRIVEVDISNKQISSYAIRFFKLILALMYAVSIFLLILALMYAVSIFLRIVVN